MTTRRISQHQSVNKSTREAGRRRVLLSFVHEHTSFLGNPCLQQIFFCLSGIVNHWPWLLIPCSAIKKHTPAMASWWACWWLTLGLTIQPGQWNVRGCEVSRSLKCAFRVGQELLSSHNSPQEEHTQGSFYSKEGERYLGKIQTQHVLWSLQYSLDQANCTHTAADPQIQE